MSNILCCPNCKSSSLAFLKERIECEDCNSVYPIFFGIPILMKGASYDEIKQMFYSERKLFKSRILGVETYKINFYIKKMLYRLLKITLPKLRTQYNYWTFRGKDYMESFFGSDYVKLELFFQNLLVNNLKELEWESFFEAGCGFGWNIRRVKEEFPKGAIGGLDFSPSQLYNGKYNYLKKFPELSVVGGDATEMPYIDNAFDIGFSLGVFMNIHPSKIRKAISEMLRVSKKYIIHLEYDEEQATRELREKRKFKTNIVSHNYIQLYKEVSKEKAEIMKFLSHKNFGEQCNEFIRRQDIKLKRWEQWEGPSKYVFIVIKKHS